MWSVLDESENFQQRFDVPMAKQVVRPSVQEKVREEVDLALKDLLANMKQQVLKMGRQCLVVFEFNLPLLIFTLGIATTGGGIQGEEKNKGR